MPSPATGLRLSARVWTISTLWLHAIGTMSSVMPMPDQSMAEKSHTSPEALFPHEISLRSINQSQL
jgi:hypothetical protein